MIRVLMLDLGQTLVDAQLKPFAHVRTALTALAGFHTAAGAPLHSCLVSDYTMVPPPLSAAKLKPVVSEYLALLDKTGLRAFFEPVDRHVTLSTQAGVSKPAAAIFEKALSRLHVKATLAECLFITENAEHVAAVRQLLGMQALQFRPPGVPAAPGFDFDDWSQLPALVAQRINAPSPANLHAAVGAHLAARGVEVDEVDVAADGDGPWPVTGRRWHPVELPGMGQVHVAIPARGHVQRGAQGTLAAQLPEPPSADLAEAAHFARSLATHGQIAGAGGASPGASSGASLGTTHAIETDAEGRQRLVRKRFSAA